LEFQKSNKNHVNCLTRDAHFMYDKNGDWMGDSIIIPPEEKEPEPPWN
jgi:hypothetical protein